MAIHTLLVPTKLRKLYSALFAEFTKRSRAIPLGRFTPNASVFSRQFDMLEDPAVKLHSWNRRTIPLLDGGLIRPGVTRIAVPGRLAFEFLNENELPKLSPHVTIRSPRGRYSGTGARALLSIRRPNQRRPERHRRRQDQKSNTGYRRLLTLVNRTYGPISEYLELIVAYDLAHSEGYFDAERFITLVAINEAIDRIYAKRARLLKRHVYQSGYWPFPVGYDTLSRLWR